MSEFKDIDSTGVSIKTYKQFIGYLAKTTPEEFFGVVKMMGLDIVSEDNDVENHVLKFKEPDLLLEEVLDKFCYLSRDRRKNLMKILKKTVKGRK